MKPRSLHKFRGHTDARYEIMRYLDWYNRRRRHSALDMHSPINYDLHHQSVAKAA